MFLTRLLLVPVALIAWLAGPGPVSAAVLARVNDEGKFFSTDAIERANQKITQIYRDYNKDLLVDTVAAVPANVETKYKELGTKEFFKDWARSRAESAGVKGIYVLICQQPPHLQIEVDKLTRQKAFTLEERDGLVKQMVAQLGQKKSDAALLEAVDFISARLQANVGKQPTSAAKHANAPVARGPDKTATGAPTAHNKPQAQQPSILGWVWIGIAVLLGFWLLVALMRAFSGGGAGGGYGGAGYPGGGGFFSSLLGGLFGAAAGMWIYDSFFGGGSRWGASEAYGGSTADQGSLEADQAGAGDFSGDSAGGGDFGDSGGGDFGGGDFGGGDFGGGDF